MSRPVTWVLVGSVGALVLAGCTPESSPGSPSSQPTSSSPSPSTAAASPSVPASPPAETQTATPTLLPGEPCDPADGSPDCTDATGIEGGGYRYIEGYADCVATFGGEEAYGICFDLEGDGYAGYPDSG